jgi:hypothetical protein
MEDIGRFDIAATFVVAVMFAAAYGMTKRSNSSFDRQLAVAEKAMIWMIFTMFSALVLARVVRL